MVIMKMRTPLLAALPFVLASSGAWAGPRPGDHMVSADIGALKMTGPDRNSYESPGWFVGLDYFYELTPELALGTGASWNQPHSKGEESISQGKGTRLQTLDSYSFGPLARWNLATDAQWVPYVAAGPALRYRSKTVTDTFPKNPGNDTSSNVTFWRISGMAAVGIDYLQDDWIAGAEMRYQNFSSNGGGLIWSVRAGYRFRTDFSRVVWGGTNRDAPQISYLDEHPDPADDRAGILLTQ